MLPEGSLLFSLGGKLQQRHADHYHGDSEPASCRNGFSKDEFAPQGHDHIGERGKWIKKADIFLGDGIDPQQSSRSVDAESSDGCRLQKIVFDSREQAAGDSIGHCGYTQFDQEMSARSQRNRAQRCPQPQSGTLEANSFGFLQHCFPLLCDYACAHEATACSVARIALCHSIVRARPSSSEIVALNPSRRSALLTSGMRRRTSS